MVAGAEKQRTSQLLEGTAVDLHRERPAGAFGGERDFRGTVGVGARLRCAHPEARWRELVLDRWTVGAAFIRQEEVGDDSAVRQAGDRVEVDLVGEPGDGRPRHEHVAGYDLVEELEVWVFGQLLLVLHAGEGTTEQLRITL